MGLIPGSGSSPGGGHGKALQYSHLENRMDRGVWRATVHRFAKSQTRLKCLSMHAHLHRHLEKGPHLEKEQYAYHPFSRRENRDSERLRLSHSL